MVNTLFVNTESPLLTSAAAGPSLLQQNGVWQGCPLSPTLFGILFDSMHGHLDRSLPHAGLQLGSGREGERENSTCPFSQH